MSDRELIDPSSVPADAVGDTAAPLVKPSLWQLLAVFAKIGSTSFGGGITGWTMRIVVDERAWMTMDDFLTGLAMCQALPGVNVINLAIWVGYRLGGGVGALVCCLGILAPAAVIIALLAALFAALGNSVAAHLAFAGAAAAAIGLSLQVGVRAVQHSAKTIVPSLIIATTFVAVGLFKISIIPVVLILGPLGVLIEFWRHRRRA
jgi:chromate transporter